MKYQSYIRVTIQKYWHRCVLTRTALGQHLPQDLGNSLTLNPGRTYVHYLGLFGDTISEHMYIRYLGQIDERSGRLRGHIYT